MSAAAARWDAFLTQIRERHAAICEEALEGSKAALAQAGFDTTPISHAWMAVTDRLKELERRVIDTWNDKVEGVFEAEGVDRATQMAERRRGEDLAFNLENQREVAELGTWAHAAREMHARAVTTQTERNCVHCGSPLAIPITYRALNVTCGHCRSIVTFEPGTTARMAIAMGSHAMAWESAHPHWLAMRNAERRIRDTRSPTPLALLKAYERAQLDYWFQYIGARANFEPELHDVAFEVRSRMQFWWTQMDTEEEWRRAGSPREKV